MRCGGLTLLLLPAILLSLPAAPVAAESSQEWSGVIEIVEYLDQPRLSTQREAQLQAFVAACDERLAQRREALTEAQDVERPLIQHDIMDLESHRHQAQLLLGGKHELSRSRFYLKRAPLWPRVYPDSRAQLRAEVGGGVLVANWREGLLRGRDRWQRFEGALPLSEVELLKPGEEAGEPFAEYDTLRLSVRSREGRWQVDFIPELPNPWAGIVTTDLDHESYPVQLARIPGLPVRAQRPLERGGHLRLEVDTLNDELDDDADLFANP